jgi:AsmA protein
MAGILDNPDAAYAKLKEMGKGLFGANGGGLGGLLGNLGGTLGGNQSGTSGATGNDSNGGAQGGGLLGGKLGETLGNLIHQGLGGSGGRGRSIPPISGAPEAQNTTPPLPPPAPPQTESQGDGASPPVQDSQPMNDVLRNLFNRSQN